jgi:hypothetical protein
MGSWRALVPALSWALDRMRRSSRCMGSHRGAVILAVWLLSGTAGPIRRCPATSLSRPPMRRRQSPAVQIFGCHLVTPIPAPGAAARCRAIRLWCDCRASTCNSAYALIPMEAAATVDAIAKAEPGPPRVYRRVRHHQPQFRSHQEQDQPEQCLAEMFEEVAGAIAVFCPGFRVGDLGLDQISRSICRQRPIESASNCPLGKSATRCNFVKNQATPAMRTGSDGASVIAKGFPGLRDARPCSARLSGSATCVSVRHVEPLDVADRERVWRTSASGSTRTVASASLRFSQRQHGRRGEWTGWWLLALARE